MSKFHLGWFLGPGITIQGWNEPGFAPGYDWTKPDIFVDAARETGVLASADREAATGGRAR